MLISAPYLIDANNHAIDPSSLGEHAVVTVTGVIGLMQATDASGDIAVPINLEQRQKIDKTGVWDTDVPVLKIDSITLSSQEQVSLRLAIARPSTQPSPATMP
jgi:hypothetical protein